MSAQAYSEDLLVEQPALGLFATLGWQTVSARAETVGPGGSLGRETRSDVVLVGRLRAALRKFNPTLPAVAIETAIDELTRDRSAMSPEAANREIYRLIKDGVSVTVPDARSGGQDTERVRVIDWASPHQNDFLLASQFTIQGSLYPCRPDLVGFVNGLPWVVIELKKPAVPARHAFEHNLSHYKQQIPQLFWYSALLIASNGTDSRVGSLTADWERYFEWKRIEREDEPRRVSLERMVRGTCDRTRLLDLVENFTLFSEHKAGLVKVLGQNHQYLGVNNAIASMLEARKRGHGRGGVFWQTQGSGKSFSMVFFAQKVLRKLAGNWTFVIITDRVELDDQIAKTFKSAGAVSASEGETCHATSGEHLRQLLRGNHRYVFTLIHKFKTAEVLTERADVIVLTDEAHRSQYDMLALNLRASLPKATFLAFTGTPLIAGEERTREVFGDYVSIYDFQQSVEDRATVPLFYDNRTPELQLVNPDLNDDLYRVIEDAGLDDEQEAKLEKVLGQKYHLITRDDRLDTVAQDIVQHFLGRGFVGKAMVVSIDKATALRMHDKVKRFWAVETARVQGALRRQDLSKSDRASLTYRLGLLTSTDMAVIVSSAQNEIELMKKRGLDIVPHRRRMNESQPSLDEKFKDSHDPLRLVFVCAMWLTGFDAPSCSTVYLDKPMRNHTLMQTIARANRVFPGKHSGVIVDYANVFASLEKALAMYGAGQAGQRPVKDKAQLVLDLRQAVSDATAFCASQGVDLAAIEGMSLGGLERLSAVGAAVESLIAPESVRRDFLAHEQLVRILFRAVKPNTAALEFAERIAGIATLAAAIRAKLSPNPPDISDILGQIGELLDESIAGLAIREAGPPPIDLSKINFAALAQRFQESKHKNTDLEAIKAAIRARLDRLVRLNRTRADFSEKFEALIESYNAGSRNIEQLFEELLKLSQSLDEEQSRHVRENLSEEELVVFDILTRPAPELTRSERAEVKKVARELLDRLKQLLVLNWRQKTAARSALRLTIEDTLDTGLPRAYSKDIYLQKCAALFEHIYESYPERHRSIYSEVA
ncbi:MAG: type I restriction endonuclease subunit R [Myxococcales bacterium]|nr:type I restriction endonuclease subunit R [Myxococcales bacterium]